MRTILVVAILMTACSGDPSESSTDKTGEPEDTGEPTTDTINAVDTTNTGRPTTDFSARLNGIVSSRSGPIGGVSLRFCRGAVCRNATTDTAGAYVYEQVTPAWYALEVVPPIGSGFATPCAPLLFEPDQARTVDFTLLPYDPPSQLGPSPEAHAAGEGLTLTLGEGELEPPLFADPATEVSGVYVPEDQRIPVDGVAGTVLGMWYLHPFDHHAIDPAGIPAQFEDTFGLEEGIELEVYVAQYPDGLWVSAGTAAASGGQLTGATLPFLSTVILVAP